MSEQSYDELRRCGALENTSIDLNGDDDDEIVIEKDVPVPKRTTRDSVRHVIDAMEPGDSILVPSRGWPSKLIRRRGYHVCSRKQPDGRYRVWMVDKEKAE